MKRTHAVPASVWRLVDANLNRAREGLRVCEDIVRFGLGWQTPYRQLRSIRHGLDGQLRRAGVRVAQLVAARDSRRDPGRRARSPSVASLEQLLLINLQRTKEALRAVEEASRLFAPRATPGFQQLRFRTYDVERDLLLRVAALRDRGSFRRRRT